MGTLRTEGTEKKYREFQAAGGLEGECALCTKSAVREFRLWKLVRNDFPYDRVAKEHDMLISVRHATEAELTIEELKEFKEIKDAYLNEHYEYILEATHKHKTIPGHFHLHLIVGKDSG